MADQRPLRDQLALPEGELEGGGEGVALVGGGEGDALAAGEQGGTVDCSVTSQD